jgi:hypothetical protein
VRPQVHGPPEAASLRALSEHLRRRVVVRGAPAERRVHDALRSVVCRHTPFARLAQRGLHQRARVRRGPAQRHRDAPRVLAFPAAERIGPDEHQQLPGVRGLPPPLEGRRAGVPAHRLAQWLDVRDRLTEGAGAGDLLLRPRHVLEADAGMALQLADDALHHHAEAPAQHRGFAAGQVECGLYALGLQGRGQLPAYAPELADRRRGQHRIDSRSAFPELAHLGQARGVRGSRPPLDLLGDMGCSTVR